MMTFVVGGRWEGEMERVDFTPGLELGTWVNSGALMWSAEICLKLQYPLGYSGSDVGVGLIRWFAHLWMRLPLTHKHGCRPKFRVATIGRGMF